jgi:hypothetical protein
MTRSWHQYILGCVVMFTMATPGVAMAEQDATVAAEPTTTSGRLYITQARRKELYDQAKLSHSAAIKRSLLLPGLGNIYADRVFKGMLIMSVAGMSLGVFAGGFVRKDRNFLIAGGGALVGVYTFAAISSYQDVNAYNATLRDRYKVQLVPTLAPEHKGLALRLDF